MAIKKKIATKKSAPKKTPCKKTAKNLPLKFIPSEESLTKYYDLYENAPDMFASVDVKTAKIISCNQTLADTLGKSKKEIIGHLVFKIYHRNSQDKAKKTFQSFIKNGKVNNTELQLKRRDGSVINVSLNASAVRDKKGNIIYSRSVLRDISERKWIEGNRQMNHNMFNDIIEGTTDAIYVKDLKGHYKTINSSGAAFIGRSVEYITGKTDFDLFKPKSTQKIIEDDHRIIKDRKTRTFEEKVTAGDVTRTYLTTKGICFDHNGKVSGIFGISRDITDRKNAEESIKESERKYRDLFDNANDGICTVDTFGNIIICNQEFAKMFGYTEKEIMGKNSGDFIHLKDRKRIMGMQKKRFMGKNVLPVYEFLGVKKNGEPTHIEINASPIKVEGKVIGTRAILRNITERKQAEEFLRESESKLSAITNTATDAIMMIDNKGRVSYWNPAAEKMFDYSKKEVLGQNICQIIIPLRDIELHKNGFDKFVKTGGGPLIGKMREVSAMKKDGSEFTVELSVSGVNIKGLWYAAGIIRDISKRKKLEEQLLQSQKMEAVGQLAG
ncbi:MAG: PAS domain-containing protein, partial [Candidatus Mariimomonas ferrooxydans]